MRKLFYGTYVFLAALLSSAFPATAQKWSTVVDLPQLDSLGTASSIFTASLTQRRLVDVIEVANNSLWLDPNNGSGGLSPKLQLLASNVVAAASLPSREAGLDDLVVVGSENGTVVLYRLSNTGTGIFSPPSVISVPVVQLDTTCKVTVGDIDGVNDADFVIGCGSQPGVLAVGINDGPHSFPTTFIGRV